MIPHSVPVLNSTEPPVLGDLLHDAVAVALLVGNRHQHVKHRFRHRQIVAHTAVAGHDGERYVAARRMSSIDTMPRRDISS
jgi:hypothetical protein